ncbi:MAG: hypothetical protein KF901_30755, partial [Myxococcales bacterium]|nr:hypothetical protein [Myxococcales bacterium]
GGGGGRGQGQGHGHGHGHGGRGDATALLSRALGRALLLVAVPTVLLALNQLRVRNCAPLEGLAFLALGPGIGVLLAALFGLFWGAALPHPRLALALAALTPVASDAWGLIQFWRTPAIFVFDPFAGWFPGTLYDEDVGLPPALLTYRAFTLAWLGAASLAFAALWRDGRLRPAALLASRRLTVCAVLLLTAGLVGRSVGVELGHRTAPEAIWEALGATHEGERCVIHVPRELSRAQRRRLLEDCDFRVANAERMLGVVQTERVHAYFYRDAEEKRRWMGAGSTYIAKPWRAEVHLQLRGWPHPVLAHEVVHVVAGNAARGPFRVSGTWGGWLPNPGFIEGIAVAVEWPDADGMTPHEWARALREIEGPRPGTHRLPPLSELLGLGFLRHPARDAYASAGSFVRWALDTKGAEAVRQAHAAGNATALGADLGALEREWHAFLDTVSLDERQLALARLRFSGSSIFTTTCPHVLARLRRDLGADLAAGDDRGILRTCEAILSIDGGDLSARLARVGALARRGAREDAEQEIALLESGAPPPLVAAAQERLADALWLAGEREAARELYARLLALPQSDDELRGRELKRVALDEGGPFARLVRDLLVGPDGRGTSAPLAVHLGHEITRAREDGLGAYLVARQLAANERFDLALPLFSVAEERGLPDERFIDENLRLWATAAYAEGDLTLAETLFERARERPALVHRAEDWLSRIAWAKSRPRL